MLYVGTNFGLYEYHTSLDDTGTIQDFCASCGEGGGTIYALKIIGNTLYVGGSFSETISGSDSRQNLASYDISNSTPVLASWEGRIVRG